METLEGTVSRLQGKGPIYNVSFRLDGQPVRFQGGNPIPFSNGDRLKVVGRRRTADLYVYAARDLATGAVLHRPLWSNVILAVILLFFDGFGAMMAGAYIALPFSLFLASSIYLTVSAVRTSLAVKLVRR